MKVNKIEDLKIINLTDKAIDALAKNNVITDWHDFNLKYRRGDILKSWKNSVYDGMIFGSIFSDTCNCGSVTKYNTPCTKCLSVHLDEQTSLMRFGKIELPIYYVSHINIGNFTKFIKRTFPKAIYDLVTSMNNKNGIPFPRFTELYQFDYDPDSESLIVTDKITDISKCSYEGLLQIIMKYIPSKVGEYLNYVNKEIIVAPLPMRPIKVSYDGNSRNLSIHDLSSAYQSIIRAIGFREKFIDSADSLVEVNLINANFRTMIRSSMRNVSSLIKASKQNFSRSMQGFRVANSGRCVIVPDPNLKLNEVSIPRSLVYEAAGAEFIKYLVIVTGKPEKDAKRAYTNNATSKEIQDLFNKYVNGDESIGLHPLHVIINRQPTLYEDNFLFSKVILNNEESMKIPLSICANFNADFDGDQMSFYVVPNEFFDYVDSQLNARTILYKKKNLNPSFLPRQEILSGLIIASSIRVNSEALAFDTLEQAEQYRKSHLEVKYQDRMFISSKKTTLGRAKLSDYFQIDLDAVTGEDKPINKETVLDLYLKLHELPDWIDRQNDIEKFALLCITLNGSTTLSIEKLMMDVNPEFEDEVKKVAESKVLNAKQKSLRYQELYNKYAEDHLSKYSEDIKNELTNQSRADIKNLVATSFPTLIVGLTGDFKPSKRTLINGMTEQDYKDLSISSRGVSQTKVILTPASGNTTRLLVFALEEMTYTDGNDEKNSGIYLEAWRAIGRTKIDGTIVERTKSKELVKVRSLLTSTLMNPYLVTSDMISNLFNYREGQAIGQSWAMVWNESTTQSALALKHKGQLLSIDDNSLIKSEEDCTVTEHDKYLEIMYDGKTDILPKPSDYVQNYSPNNKYKKGDIIGTAWKVVLPSYKLIQIVQFICTRQVAPKRNYGKDEVIIGECYAYNSGIIEYEFGDDTKVRIGDMYYRYNPKLVYRYPSGTYIEKGTRICSGLLDINTVFYRLGDYIESFHLFDKQLSELTPSTTPELNEAIYKSIVYSDEFQNIVLKGVRRTNLNRMAPYTRMCYESSSDYFKKTLSGSITDFMSDNFTASMLPNILSGDIGLNL